MLSMMAVVWVQKVYLSNLSVHPVPDLP